MKQILSYLLVAFIGLSTVSAKTDKQAKNILDKTAAVIKKAGDIEAQFTATSFKGKTEMGKMSGVIKLHGTAFKMISDNVVYWYDGTTLWNYVKENDEVNVSVPPVYEQQAMNPYTFISLYRKGYDYEYGESSLRGMDCYCIHLMATEVSQKIREMYLDIDKKNYYPICIRMRRGTDGWTRISIQDFKTNQKYNDSMFKFDKKEYPSAEIIDLR